MTRPRVAIVGCGRMGRTRFEAVLRHGADVVALVDPDRARAEELAAGRDIALLSDPARLQCERIDAVFVCTPPSQRGSVELQAIDCGVALFLEKPIGLGARHMLPVVQALRDRPVITAVGYMNRYRPSVEKARQHVQADAMIGLSANWVGRPYNVPWWQTAAGSGGPVNEQATHLVDLSRFLVGEVSEVHALARASRTSPDVSESVAISLRFANGAIGSLLYSCAADEKMIEFRLFSRRAEVRLEGWDFRWRGDEAANAAPQTRDDPVFTDETGIFLDAVTTGVTNRIRSDFFDAFRTQQVVDAVVASIRSGQTETIS